MAAELPLIALALLDPRPGGLATNSAMVSVRTEDTRSPVATRQEPASDDGGSTDSDVGTDEQERTSLNGGSEGCGEGSEAGEQLEDLSMDVDEAEWAARRIQQSWRHHQCLQRHADGDADTAAQSPRPTPSPRPSGMICCACFTPLETADAHQNLVDDSVFCHACRSAVVDPATAGMNASVRGSPLPKLGLLMQTQAKLHDQLDFLRQQQELLHHQQEKIAATKRAQAQTAELAKQLARQRRRQFQAVMARRREEEEAKMQQLLADDTAHAAKVAATPPPRTKRRTTPQRSPSSSLSSPHQDETPSVTVVVAGSFHMESRASSATVRNERTAVDSTAAVKVARMVEKAAQEHRRKQQLKLANCYAQDLTPLVRGQKPKKLAVQAPPITVTSTKSKPAHTPGNSLASSKHKSRRVRGLQPLADKIGRTRISNQCSGRGHEVEATNNVLEPNESDLMSPIAPLRVRIPTRPRHQWASDLLGTGTSQATPLTAEIKPVSWINALGKDVLGDDAVATTSTTPLMAPTQLGIPLGTVHEVSRRTPRLGYGYGHDDGDGESDDEEQWRLEGIRSPSANRVTLAPLVPSSSPKPMRQAVVSIPDTKKSDRVSSYTSHTSSSSSSSSTTAINETASAGKWEYSSERLASLLEKYNVSVSSSPTVK